MGRRPLRYTRTDPSFPYTTLFRSGLQNLRQKQQCIGDVRGRGLLLGVEFIPHGGQSATAITSKVTDTALELGVSANITGAYSAGTMRLAPPITSTEEEIDFGLEVLDAAITRAVATVEEIGRASCRERVCQYV